jgi:hypothetical protein
MMQHEHSHLIRAIETLYSIANFSYRLDGEGRIRRHSMVLCTMDRSSASRLSDTLEATETVLEFRIAPTGD